MKSALEHLRALRAKAEEERQEAAGERDARPRSDARHPSGGLRHIHAIDAAALAIRIAALDEAIEAIEKEASCRS